MPTPDIDPRIAALPELAVDGGPFDYESVLRAGLHHAQVDRARFPWRKAPETSPFAESVAARLGHIAVEIGALKNTDTPVVLEIARPFDLFIMRGSIRASIRHAKGDTDMPFSTIAGTAQRAGIMTLEKGSKLSLIAAAGPGLSLRSADKASAAETAAVGIVRYH